MLCFFFFLWHFTKGREQNRSVIGIVGFRWLTVCIFTQRRSLKTPGSTFCTDRHHPTTSRLYVRCSGHSHIRIKCCVTSAAAALLSIKWSLPGRVFHSFFFLFLSPPKHSSISRKTLPSLCFSLSTQMKTKIRAFYLFTDFREWI